MARHIGCVAGNWGTAGTWNQVTNTPTIHATTNITVSTTPLYTLGYTAPNTTNAFTGIAFYVASAGTAGTLNITLQESTIDTACTLSFNLAGVTVGWLYCRVATPYVFTTTGASAYRVKYTITSGSGTWQFAADSGGSNAAFLASDDRAAVPGTTDDVWILGNNNTNDITVTVDSTQTIGSGTDTALATSRSVGNAVSIGANGILSYDTTATSGLTCLGNLLVVGTNAEHRMGTVASPLNASYTATLTMNQNGTSGRHGIAVAIGGKWTMQGAAKSSTTLWKTTYSSGLGTAASPLITGTAVDWVVGDHIVVAGDAYNEPEERYIITKNSATSYVLSNTAGGAENALVNTHQTDNPIINIGRNVIITTNNAAQATYFNNYSITSGNTAIKWARFNNIGMSTANKRGVYLGFSTTTSTADADYSVVYNGLYNGWLFNTSTVAESFTGLICVNFASAPVNTFAMGSESTCSNKTLIDPVIINVPRTGLAWTSAKNITVTNPIVWNACTGNTANTAAFATNSTNVTVSGGDFQAGRQSAVNLSGAVNNRFFDCNFGNKSSHVTDVAIFTNTVNLTYFEECNFGSATLISNYLNGAAGSIIGFQTMNGTDYNNRWYTNTGMAMASGAGLTDTTVRTADTHNVSVRPEDATDGFVWEYKQLARVGQFAQASGRVYCNAAFLAASDASILVELFLPGSFTADASQTMTRTTDDESQDAIYNFGVAYTGAKYDYFKVRITVKTATAGAYAYIADLLQGSNNITNFNTWTDGQPSPIMFDQLGDPQANWSVLAAAQTDPNTLGYYISAVDQFAYYLWEELLSNHTSEGSAGKALIDALKLNDYIALKNR